MWVVGPVEDSVAAGVDLTIAANPDGAVALAIAESNLDLVCLLLSFFLHEFRRKLHRDQAERR